MGSDMFRIQAELKGGPDDIAKKQREISLTIGRATKVKPFYDRSQRFYVIGAWTMCRTHISSGDFAAADLEPALKVFQMLEEKGYSPVGSLSLFYMPPGYNPAALSKVMAHVNMRQRLIEKALDVGEGGFEVLAGDNLEIRLRLPALQPETIEASALLIRQLFIYCASIRNVRLADTEISNEKYQMRTWLTRIGFIGVEFARARRTLLSNLSGSSTFRTESSRQQANRRRKAKRLTMDENTGEENTEGETTGGMDIGEEKN